MKNNVVFFVVALMFILVTSCSKGEMYYRFHHIPPHGKWWMDSVMVFTMDSLHFRPEKKVDISVELTANTAYPYRNLWLYIDHTVTDSVFRRDSVQCFLADEFGKRLGSGIGGLRQLSVPFLSAISLDTARVYELKIRHAMADDPLTGIEKVGVKVVEK